MHLFPVEVTLEKVEKLFSLRRVILKKKGALLVFVLTFFTTAKDKICPLLSVFWNAHTVCIMYIIVIDA